MKMFYMVASCTYCRAANWWLRSANSSNTNNFMNVNNNGNNNNNNANNANGVVFGFLHGQTKYVFIIISTEIRPELKKEHATIHGKYRGKYLL